MWMYISEIADYIECLDDIIRSLPKEEFKVHRREERSKESVVPMNNKKRFLLKQPRGIFRDNRRRNGYSY